MSEINKMSKMTPQYIFSTDSQFDKEFIGESAQPLPCQSTFLVFFVWIREPIMPNDADLGKFFICYLASLT